MATQEEPFSITEKKIVRWAQGLVVFVTPEAKSFGWNDKTKIKVIATSDEKGREIIILKESKQKKRS